VIQSCVNICAYKHTSITVPNLDPYDKKGRKKNARFNGKQFTTQPLKKSCGLAGTTGTVLANNMFSNYDGYSKRPDPYKAQVKYIETQPPDKRNKGFGSGDAFKTDEFTNVIRTETYREQMRREKRITNKHMEKQYAKETKEAKNDAVEDQEDEDTDTTLFSTIHSSTPDVFGADRLRALRKKNRNCGFHRLSSRDYGTLCDDKKIIFSAKGKFGSNNCTSQFFDKGHLGVGRNDDLM
jgi:hypothetical protein